MRVKLSLQGHGSHVVELADACTLGDLASAAATAFSLPQRDVVLSTTFPASTLPSRIAPGDLASAHGVRSGQALTVSLAPASAPVHVPAPAPAPASAPASSSTSSAVATLACAGCTYENAAASARCEICGGSGGLGGGGGKSSVAATGSSGAGGNAPPPSRLTAAWVCAACTLRNEAGSRCCAACGSAPPPPPRVLARYIVPADNACLFGAVAYLCGGGESADAMRRLAVDEIARSPETYTDAVLGRPVAAYVAAMLLKDAWGGAIELGALSACLKIELCAIEVRTSRPYHFGVRFARRAFLIFDGIHYDAVHSVDASSGAAAATTFAADDEAALRAAVALADELRAARQFVDTSSFTLLCAVCNTGLKGEEEARAHAIATSHTNFQEYAAKQ